MAVALLVAGCAQQGPTRAETEVRDIGKALDQARRQAADCTAGIERSSDFESLSDRFALRKPAMTILANKRTPTEAEVSVLLAIHQKLAACRAQNVQMYGLAHPAFAVGLVTTFTEADIEFSKLVRREISWGRYAELTLERSTRMEARFQEAAQKVASGLRASHADEVRERESAQRAFAAWAAAQRAAMPVTTNCTYIGVMITCTSY